MLRRPSGFLRTAWVGCVLLVVAAGAVYSETLTPLRDADGNVTGNFELWKKRKIGGKKIKVPVGWVGYLNGIEGKVLFTRVEGSKGFGLKGKVIQVNHHGDKSQIPPRLEAGTRFEPYANFVRGDGIPIATRHAGVRFRYQFHAKSGSGFNFFLRMEKDGEQIGQAYLLSKTELEEWQTIDLPITYFNNETPDRCYITVDILGKQTGNTFTTPVRGTFYLIDELTFVD